MFWITSPLLQWSNGEGVEPPVVETSSTPSGVRQRRRRVYVEIDDQLFPVNSEREARELLAKAKQTAREVVAQVKADPAVKVAIPIVTVKTDEPNPRLEAIARQAQEYIAQQYKKALEAQRRMQEDEADVELLLMSL